MKTPTTFAAKLKSADLHNAAGLKMIDRILHDLEIAASLFSDSARFSQDAGAYSQQAQDARVVCESVKARLREVKERTLAHEAAMQAQAEQVARFSAAADRARQSPINRPI
jgi:hypothetical protein